MTIGNLIAIPNKSFSFRRSYLTTVSISGILGLPVVTGNVWHFPGPVLPNEDYWLIWRDGFLPWTSNMWTLDWIVAEYYHTFTGDPTHYPVDFSLKWTSPRAGVPSDILNVPFGVSTPPNTFLLEGAPSGYWNPH